MGLQYAHEHTGCIFYATDQTALFRLFRLQEGERLPDIANTSGLLIYIGEGSFSLTLEDSSSQELSGGKMIFVSQADSLEGQATEPCSIITCAVPFQIPLCLRYDMEDLSKDTAQMRSKYYNTPPHHTLNCL